MPPSSKKPFGKKPASKKPASKKPASKKPASKKPAPKKPVSKRPTRTARSVPDTPNPFASHNWPFKRGQSVYYLASNEGRVAVRVGTVTAYHPFLPSPLVAVYQSDGALMVRLADVAEFTVDGKTKLEVAARDRQLENAAKYERLPLSCGRK